jgi:hypothetical protein
MNFARKIMLHCRGLWLMLGVHMSVELLAGAFVAGTTLSAAAGNLIEARAQLRGRLDRPFVDSGQIAMSLLRVLFAGPYLLVGEASVARQEGRAGRAVWSASILFAGLWSLASGILCLEFIWQIAQHLSLTTL